MTLSVWLRDYIYIPLGGNRKGEVRRYLNILVVFCVSGIWHGAGLTYLLWGALHGFYQIAGGIVKKKKVKPIDTVKNTIRRMINIGITFLLVTFAWMLFRAQSLSQFAEMVKGIFAVWNPKAILDGDAYYKMGLSRLQTVPLAIGIMLLFVSDFLHEKGISVRQWISLRPMPIRWMIFLTAVFAVLIFGTYGPAYSDNQFIYGRF